MLKLVSAKLTGTPGESGWSQGYEFTPEDSSVLRSRGILFVVVATGKTDAGDGPVESISLGRELIAKLHEEYFGDLTQKPFNALASAVSKVVESSKGVGGLEIVASAFVGGVVFSAAYGGGKVTILRQGAIGTILSSGEKTVAASGFPKNGDVLLMGTKTFFETIPAQDLKKDLSEGAPNEIIDTFTPSVRATGDLGSLGVCVVKFAEETFFQKEKSEEKTFLPNTDLKNKTAGFFNRIKNRFPKRSVYVGTPLTEEATSQSKKITFSVAIILLVVLGVSIGFGIRQKNMKDLKGKYMGLLTDAESEVDQAISLAAVSPDKSRELFVDSEQKLSEIDAMDVKDSKVDDLRKKIDESRAAVLGEYNQNPDMFLDLSLLSSGFKGDEVAASGGQIYILDKSGMRLVSVAFDTKKSKVVAGPSQINEALGLASYEDRSFVLMSDGVYEVGPGKNKIIDKTWSGEALIRAFAGNLYLLDKSGNQIYRYQSQGNSFKTGSAWLSGDASADFSNALSWAIDGSVYVLYPNSKVLKFSQGSPQSFSVSGVVPEIGSVDAIYADADTTDVYLLDRAGKRVVVVDKKGKYVAQYINDQIAQATNLVVSEADKKIILLIGDKLYSIDIKP